MIYSLIYKFASVAIVLLCAVLTVKVGLAVFLGV